MIHQVVTSVSLDAFKERLAGKKFVLLYPWSPYRNVFLSHFFATEQDDLLYYSVPAAQNTLNLWLDHMADHLVTVVDGFGNRLKNANTNDPIAAAQALAEDLNAYAQEHDGATLFWDELDHVTFDEMFNQFIQALADALHDNTQIAVSSRLLRHYPWYNIIASERGVVLGTEQQNDDIMFTIEDDVKPQIEIYGFGQGHAVVNGQEIVNWDGALPRNLFFYFVDNTLVTRDDIFATFWPKLNVKEATNVFHVTKRKISERISTNVDDDEDYELTRYASGFYMPSDKVTRHYDVQDFQESIEQAMIIKDENEKARLYSHAIGLYKSPFLETIDMEWVVDRRVHLQSLFSQALIGLARIKRKHGNNEEALGMFNRALKEVPTREDIHREVMLIYQERDMIEDARRQYHALADALKAEYRIKPAPETIELYESLG
jgi:two-component SAPR family response regulator